MFDAVSCAYFSAWLNFSAQSQFQVKKIITNSNLEGKTAKKIYNGFVLISHFTISTLDQPLFY